MNWTEHLFVTREAAREVLHRIRREYGQAMCVCDLHSIGVALGEIPQPSEEEIMATLSNGPKRWWNGIPATCDVHDPVDDGSE